MILGFEYGGQKEEYRVHKELRELSPLAFLKFVEIINKPEINGQDAREFMHLAYGIKMLYLDQITELKLIELLNEIGVFKEERVCGKSFFPKLFFLWKGPKDYLSNTCFKQFGLMEESMVSMLEAVQSKDIEEVKKQTAFFMAAAYTPFGMNWKPWIGNFNLWLFKKCRLSSAGYALESYHWMRAWFMQYFPLSFSASSSDGRSFGYQGLTVDISGSRFGSIKTAELQKVHSVFVHIEQSIEIKNQND